MAKRNKGTTELSGGSPEKKTGIFQVLLLWFIIPLLFAAAVVLIIAKFADVNVFDKAKEWSAQIPLISKNAEDEEAADGDQLLEDRVVSLQAEIQEKEAQLFSLQEDLDKSEAEKEQLLAEQEKLLDEIAALVREKDDTKRSFKEVVSTFEKMSAKAAAPVITKMSDAEAIRILTSLKPDTLAPILEKMEPADAAKYTSMMTDSTMAE